MANVIPDHLIDSLANGNIDLKNDSIHVFLVNKEFIEKSNLQDISSCVHDAADFSVTRPIKFDYILQHDKDSDFASIIANSNPSWSAVNKPIIAAGAVFYDIQAPIDNDIIYIMDFNGEQTAEDGGKFTLIINSAGLFSIEDYSNKQQIKILKKRSPPKRTVGKIMPIGSRMRG